MPLDSTGLSIPTLQEIKNQLSEDLQTNLGIPVDTSANAVAGIINSIYSAALSNAYELIQTFYTQRTLEGAEGVNLDDLAAYTNTFRLGATYSRTNKAHFTGEEGTAIAQNSLVTNPATNERFLVESPITITTSSCYSTILSIGTLLNNTDYPISVNGSNFTYTSDANATEDEILTGLEAAFSDTVGYSVTKVGSTLEITSEFIDVPLTVATTTYLLIDEVTSIGVLKAENTGPVIGPINSLTKITTPVGGWTSVTNPEAVIVGRNRETDEELLARQQSSTAIARKGTPDAIITAIRSISGVTGVFVIENDTSVQDLDLRPPKSYEVVVSGSTDELVAQAIWDSKPAGIETVGTITESATDVDGNSRQVFFSRPSDVYIHVEVTYTVYDEEIFPATGEDAIKEAILATASTLDIDEDVIPKRFYGNIYSSVQGIQDLVVGMTKTVNPSDPPGTFSEATIPIGFKEVAAFSLDRITVVGP